MHVEETKQLLLGTRLLSILSAAELEDLASCFEEIYYKLGNTVCRAGEPGEAFYVVCSGRARAVGLDAGGKEVTLDILSRGAHFGEQALLTGEPWEFTVRAAGNLVVLRLAKDRFLQLLDQKPDLKHYFQDYISDTAVRNFIKQCTVFSPIAPEELRGFLDAFTPLSFAPDEYIVREGEEGDSFYLIRTGEVKVVRDNQGARVLNRLRDGEFFGELALLTGAPRAASVVAESAVKVFRLAKEDFERVIARVPQIRDAILGVAAGYSREARDLLVGVPGGPVPEAGVPVEEPEPEPLPEAPANGEEDKEDAAPTAAYTPRRSRRFPVLLQQSAMDCGAACLTMICRYYGLKISINRLREMANVSRDGATLYSLAEAAESLGFRTRGLRGDFAALAAAPLPAVAHWEGYHYIVVYRVDQRRGTVTVADPALGQRRLSKDEFLRGWTGTLLLLTPTPALEQVEPSHSTFARFYPLITAHRGLLVQVLMASLLIQLFGLAVPLFTQNIVDKVLVQQDVLMLNLMLAGMLVVAFFQVATNALRQYMLVFAARHIDLAMMVQFYNHVLGLPLKYFEDRKVGDIISRLHENEKIRQLLTGTTLAVVMDVLTVAVYLSLMFYYNAKLTLLAVMFIPLFVIFTLIFTPLMKKTSREIFQAKADAQSYMVESVGGINTVKALAVEKQVRWKWEVKIGLQLQLQQKGALVVTTADSTSRTLQTLSTVLILWYGATLVLGGEVTIGQLMAFNILLGSVIGPIMRVVGLWDQFQEARVALERVNDVLDAAPEPGRTGDALVMPPIRGHIEFKNVTFRYHEGERNVIENVSLEIPPGHTVALVGRSGSGKTTLTNLLLRLHQTTEGEIRIDGVNLRHVAPTSLRRQIGVVLQENFLFSGTIRENIALGVAEPSMQDVVTAAMLAGAHDFVSEMPMGYDTVIGERGMNLSGGQRQRIAIARALFHKPRILMLDEATSALDTESERVIQQNLENILRDRTTIVIAHRLSTVRNADLIVVLDRGVVVEKGTHYELMEKKGLYFYLNSQQLQT